MKTQAHNTDVRQNIQILIQCYQNSQMTSKHKRYELRACLMYEVIHEMPPEYKRYYTVHMSIEWLNLYMIWQK